MAGQQVRGTLPLINFMSPERIFASSTCGGTARIGAERHKGHGNDSSCHTRGTDFAADIVPVRGACTKQIQAVENPSRKKTASPWSLDWWEGTDEGRSKSLCDVHRNNERALHSSALSGLSQGEGERGHGRPVTDGTCRANSSATDRPIPCGQRKLAALSRPTRACTPAAGLSQVWLHATRLRAAGHHNQLALHAPVLHLERHDA